MLHLSENIKLVRSLAGKTQPEFAIIIGENLSNLKTYETKNIMPKPHIQHRLAKIAGVHLDDLLYKRLTPDDIKINLSVEKVEKGAHKQQETPNLELRDSGGEIGYQKTRLNLKNRNATKGLDLEPMIKPAP